MSAAEGITPVGWRVKPADMIADISLPCARAIYLSNAMSPLL